MRFGLTLEQNLYRPWRDGCIDYARLKSLLREHEVKSDGQKSSDASPADQKSGATWSQEDEERFVDALINQELEKVNAFQLNKYRDLVDRTRAQQHALDTLAQEQDKNARPHANGQSSPEHPGPEGHPSTYAEAVKSGPSEQSRDSVQQILASLDDISDDVARLEKFIRINYTGFLKAAKKHDRIRGTRYRVRPLLTVRLASMQLGSVDFGPMLVAISRLYASARQILGSDDTESAASVTPNGEYRSLKFFIHPDDLPEVKAAVARRLPVLLYTLPSTVKQTEDAPRDPTISAIYFDNSDFALYNDKVNGARGSSSLRVRWFDQLTPATLLTIEKKTLGKDGDSSCLRCEIKDKYVKPFLEGSYQLDKPVKRLQTQTGPESESVKFLRQSVSEIQETVSNGHLEPVIRATFTRTAFEVPGDDRVRITLDTNVVFNREDASVRTSDSWRRTDLAEAHAPDSPKQKSPEGVVRFPYAILEIKERQGARRQWVEELTSSHLVREVPRFSKFVHGVASLYEDEINTLPFWMSLLETDIRRDPAEAFREQQEKQAQKAQDPLSQPEFFSSLPRAKSLKTGTLASAAVEPREGDAAPSSVHDDENEASNHTNNASATSVNDEDFASTSRLRQLLSAWSTARQAREKKPLLPPGVRRPDVWLKDIPQNQVEAKVWLANERTAVKWSHISLLLATLALALFNAAGRDNYLAQVLSLVYILIAIFTGVWGWSVYMKRSRMIASRSGRDFDDPIGPIIVSVALMLALCINFVLRYKAVQQQARSTIAS